MRVGYARTSTAEQLHSFEHQQKTLREQGCDRVFAEHISAKDTDRPEFQAMMTFVRTGDTLVVTKIDRLVRSMADLMQTIGILKERGVALKILDMNLDTGTPTGQLMIGVIGSVAEFERSLMLERQRVGIDRAKELGRYKGRVPTAKRQKHKVLELLRDQKSAREIGETLSISRASVFRIKAELRQGGAKWG